MISPETAVVVLGAIDVATLIVLGFLFYKRETTFYRFTLQREALYASERNEAKVERTEMLNRFMSRSLMEYEAGEAMEHSTPIRTAQVSDEREAEIERAFRKANGG